jgi:hypothetical protein
MSKLIEIYLGNIDNKLSIERRLEHLKILREAEKEFDKSLIRKIMKMEYETESLGEKYIKIKEYEKELRTKKQDLTAKEHNNGFCFITISPKESVSLANFKKTVEKAVARNMFTSYLYVYEQRGKNTDEKGKGFHAHILVKRNLNYKPSKVANNLKNTFKDMTNVNNPQLLNIQHIGNDFAKDKVEYITSLKTDEGKDVKQEIDVIWRQAEDLLPFYGNKDIN